MRQNKMFFWIQSTAMRLLLLTGLPALGLGATWERHVMTPKTAWVDTPEPHPLAYFTQYPMLRDESGDFCYLCSPEKRLAEAKKSNVTTDLRLVGSLAGFAIYDLYYLYGAEGAVDTKTILIKTGADLYREIYHCEPTQVDARAVPSIFVTAGKDRFLEARYIVGGKSHDHYDYFWFDASGATFVDFRPILVAARPLVPSGKTIRWIYDMDGDIPGTHWLWAHTEPLVARVGVMNKLVTNSFRVVEAGVINVEFKFDHGRVVATNAIYDPDARYQGGWWGPRF